MTTELRVELKCLEKDVMRLQKHYDEGCLLCEKISATQQRILDILAQEKP